tara:strand:- start:4 stop:183 length:180 start_codon:yes stop_codon:yes gene_type:complete
MFEIAFYVVGGGVASCPGWRYVHILNSNIVRILKIQKTSPTIEPILNTQNKDPKNMFKY